MCQSIGAAGLAASRKIGVAAFGTGIGGLVGGLWPGGKKSNKEASEHVHDNDDKPKGDNYVINKEAGSVKNENGTEEKNEVEEEIRTTNSAASSSRTQENQVHPINIFLESMTI